MQYKSLLSALVLGMAFSAEAARGGGGFGQGGRGQGQGGQGQDAATLSSAAAAATTAADTAAAATGTAAAGGNTGGNGGNGSDLELNPDAVQTGSQADGQNASGAASGQAPSNT